MKFKSSLLAIALSIASMPSPALALICEKSTSFGAVSHLIGANQDFKVITGLATKIDGESVLDVTDQTDRDEKPSNALQVSVIGGEYTADGEMKFDEFVFDLYSECHLNHGLCGSLPHIGRLQLFILHNNDGALSGLSTACGSSYFPMPTFEQSEAIKQCMAKGRCDPSQSALWEE